MDGILIMARLGSTRLPEKHLSTIQGRTVIEWLIGRFINKFSSEISASKAMIIVATADELKNKKFETIFKEMPVEIFYGSIENIPLRQAQCSESYKLKRIISVDGDDILCSPEAAWELLSFLKNNKEYDMCKSVGLPFGMNVMAYTSSYLESVIDRDSRKKLETGWGRIFSNARAHNICMGKYEDMNHLRFTLDYPKDLLFFKAIINDLREEVLSITDEELIRFVIKKKYYELNEELNEIYWSNFNDQLNAESNKQ